MIEEKAFLQTIYETPDDDFPRLVFADWLEEQGDKRAEFIRVQCEIASSKPCQCLINKGKILGRATNTKYTAEPECRYCKLIDRERELMPRNPYVFKMGMTFSERALGDLGSETNVKRYVGQWLEREGFNVNGDIDMWRDPIAGTVSYRQYTRAELIYHRGFPFGLTGISETCWVRLADKFMAEWPLLRQVHLPRVPAVERGPGHQWTTYLGVNPRPSIMLSTCRVVGRSRWHQQDWPDVTDREAVQREWPKIEFFYPHSEQELRQSLEAIRISRNSEAVFNVGEVLARERDRMRRIIEAASMQTEEAAIGGSMNPQTLE